MQNPAWADTLREIFVAGTTSTFLVHGNVSDLVAPAPERLEKGPGAGSRRYLSLKGFADEVLFRGFDLVCHYDRGVGLDLRFPSGDRELETFADRLTKSAANHRLTPPRLALEVIDRLFQHAIYHPRAVAGGTSVARKVAVVIRYAELIAPAADARGLGGELAEVCVRLLAWADDPTIVGQNVIILLVSERSGDMNRLVTESPHVEKIHIPLPGEADVEAFVEDLAAGEPRVTEMADVPAAVIAKRLVGLPRVDIRDGIFREVKNGRRLTEESLRAVKKALLEAECGHLLELIETDRHLDMVAGHTAAKKWLREDTELLRRGKPHALPMGYLLCGRIGTGKTFLVTCWAGELGIPCVVFKNFRDRWVGATEGNLEKIFTVLRALGQCLVFVDEADQFAGKRGGGSGDAGLSGRVYASLAKEMSKTENRGKIIWVFATSRPDLLEVDLKRQGRLDVHIPLFPPQTQDEKDALLRALCRKLRLPLKAADLPPAPADRELGGNEIEGALVRAMRRYELEPEEGRRPFPVLLSEVFEELRGSAERSKLRFMDLIAVRECTDRQFLPEAYRDLDEADVDREIRALDYA